MRSSTISMGGRERTCAQQQREVPRLLGGVEARDLEPLPELIANRRDVDHFLDNLLPALTHTVDELGERLVLDVHHGHGPADLVPGAVGEEPGALAVEGDEYRRRAALLIDPRRRVRDVLPREHDDALEEDRPAVALAVELRGSRRASGRECRRGFGVDHAELQGRGGPEDLLRPRRVLDTGQLDDDPVLPLLLDDRLGHTELVDAIAQRGDVLLNREALDLALGRLAELNFEHRISDVDGRIDDQLGHPPAHEIVRPVTVACVVETNDQPPVRAHRDRPLAKFLLPQQRPEIPRVPLLRLSDRSREVHLHQEVHAAAQIETQIHRQRTQTGEPPRGRGREIERDDILAVDLFFDDAPGLELIFPGCEPHEEPVRDLGLPRVDASSLDSTDESIAQHLVDWRAREPATPERRGHGRTDWEARRTCPQRGPRRSPRTSTPDTG